MNNVEFPECIEIIEEMKLVYKHDRRPWMIGFSGGKDSTMLCMLVFLLLLLFRCLELFLLECTVFCI